MELNLSTFHVWNLMCLKTVDLTHTPYGFILINLIFFNIMKDNLSFLMNVRNSLSLLFIYLFVIFQ